MAEDKRMTFSAARKRGALDEFFAQPHPPADRDRFDRLLDAMARGGAPASGKRPAKGRTSRKAKPAD